MFITLLGSLREFKSEGVQGMQSVGRHVQFGVDKRVALQFVFASYLRGVDILDQKLWSSL